MRMHNAYAVIYNELVFRLIEKRLGKGEAVVFARSAATGGQRSVPALPGSNAQAHGRSPLDSPFIGEETANQRGKQWQKRYAELYL
jgi:hypothetical protein